MSHTRALFLALWVLAIVGLVVAVSALGAPWSRPLGSPLPMDIHRTVEGWEVQVPLCGPEDAIVEFLITSEVGRPVADRDVLVLGQAGARGGRRIAVLTLTAETLASAQVAPGELTAIERSGVVDLPRALITLRTTTGYAWSTDTMSALTSLHQAVRIVGDSHPRPLPAEELLGYCDSATTG